MAGSPYERWDAGSIYEQFMGRWSEAVALRFVDWLQPGPGLCWLDIGCGTGALTRTVVEQASPRLIVGLDASPGFVHFASQHTQGAAFVAGDGGALPFEDRAFDVVVSGLALNFMPQTDRALADMRRIVKPNGTMAAYVWDYADKMEFLRYFWDAAVDLNPDARSLHEGTRFPICRPEPLRHLWQKSGFGNVSVVPIDIPTVFPTFEAYWQSFMVGNFPAPMYALSRDDDQRSRLRARLRESVPAAKDGSIQLIARVWAVRGQRR